jgi:hypothetical protein
MRESALVLLAARMLPLQAAAQGSSAGPSASSKAFATGLPAEAPRRERVVLESRARVE